MYGTMARSFENFKKFVRYASDDIRNVPTYRPDILDKKILVHFKHYPSIEAVPDRVDQHIMNKAKSLARIKVASLMMLSTVLGACLTVYYAKKNSRQNSLIEENQRRHQLYKKGETGSGSRMGLLINTKDD